MVGEWMQRILEMLWAAVVHAEREQWQEEEVGERIGTAVEGGGGRGGKER